MRSLTLILTMAAALCLALPLKADALGAPSSSQASVETAVAQPEAFEDIAVAQPDVSVGTAGTQPDVDIAGIIFGHIGDSYQWHIASWGDNDWVIPLPVIVCSRSSGWHMFSSSRLEEAEYQGFHISLEGKVVENVDGREVRPLDISITKNVLSLMISALLLLFIVLWTARWYRRHDSLKEGPQGMAAFMEPVIMMVHDMARENIGEEDYRKYSPYLIMAFLFILLNNLLGVIPFFPGGANLTGNIAITLTLALITFFTVNLTGSRQYFKDMLCPDVPAFLKPIMPVIEVFSAMMKPVSLMIRLFANMLAGHIQILSVVCIIFIMAKYGPLLLGSMSVVSVCFGIFLDCLELLISFIQAYVFTMLSSIYIGLARQKEE